MSQETCFNRDETRALRDRETDCQICEADLKLCESNMQVLMDRGYKLPAWYESKYLWFGLGIIAGGVAVHNLK